MALLEITLSNKREAEIVAALYAEQLTRIQLMKTLFLFWYRRGCPADGPFHFIPYLYGPCAFDLYETLDQLQHKHIVMQTSNGKDKWSPYSLTASGQSLAMHNDLLVTADKTDIACIARWAAGQNFISLLQEVYREAPKFATHSIVKDKTK